MKECPNCHRRYDDGMNFCIDCGTQLVSASSATVTPPPAVDDPVAPPVPPQPRRRKGGCLRTFIIVAVIAVVGFIALANHIQNAATYLRLEPAGVMAGKCGGECDVDIDYDGYIWEINHCPEWITVDEQDDKMELEVEPNTTGQPREGTITIQSGKQLAQFVVRQNAVATIVKASETAIAFSEQGGTQTIKLATDGCKLQGRTPEWITSQFGEDHESLVVKCPDNGGTYRAGVIRVWEDNAYVDITVTQSGQCPQCGGSGTIRCTACAGTGSVGFGYFSSQCYACGGQGSIQCLACGGTGRRE